MRLLKISVITQCIHPQWSHVFRKLIATKFTVTLSHWVGAGRVASCSSKPVWLSLFQMGVTTSLRVFPKHSGYLQLKSQDDLNNWAVFGIVQERAATQASSAFNQWKKNPSGPMPNRCSRPPLQTLSPYSCFSDVFDIYSRWLNDWLNTSFPASPSGRPQVNRCGRQ